MFKGMLVSALAITLALCSCRGQRSGQSGKISVFVSIAPQAYFVERVGGEHVKVDVLVPPGVEPHVFEPQPRQVARLADGKLFFQIGMPFEEALSLRLADQKSLKIVDTRRGIELIEAQDDDDHAGHDDHAKLDPHIWMSPRLALIMARTIRDELKAVDSSHAADYDANYKALEADMDALDSRLRKSLAPLEGRTFYVFHPAFGYFAREYNLKQKAVEDQGKSPSARQLLQLVEQAKADGVKVVFVQPQFSRQSAEVLARELDGAVVALDPLAKDYIANMDLIAQRVNEALTRQDE